MGRESLQDLLETLVRASQGSLKPPFWWYGVKNKTQLVGGKDLRWYFFKDLDGGPCVALIDLEQGNVVTLAKRGMI